MSPEQTPALENDRLGYSILLHEQGAYETLLLWEAPVKVMCKMTDST